MKEVEKHDEKETNNSTLIALTSSKFLAFDEKKNHWKNEAKNVCN